MAKEKTEAELAFEKELSEKFKNLFLIHKGRINRLDYFLLLFVSNGFVNLIDLETSNIARLIFLIVLLVLLTYLQACVIAGRYRDIGLSGWFAAIHVPTMSVALALFEMGVYALPALAYVLLIGFGVGFWPPQKQENKYGAYDPMGLSRAKFTPDKSQSET